jgi:hypothetical protein
MIVPPGDEGNPGAVRRPSRRAVLPCSSEKKLRFMDGLGIGRRDQRGTVDQSFFHKKEPATVRRKDRISSGRNPPELTRICPDSPDGLLHAFWIASGICDPIFTVGPAALNKDYSLSIIRDIDVWDFKYFVSEKARQVDWLEIRSRSGPHIPFSF